MTYDEVVRFAAKKVGVIVSKKQIHDSTVCDAQWYIVNEFDSITDEFDLSSPDLMLKGLEVYYKDGAPFQISPWGVKLGVQNMTFEKVEDIPVTFWQCWAELEGGQS